MKAVIWLCTCAAVVKFSFQAPVKEEKVAAQYQYDQEHLDYMRNKRLNGNARYVTPCQASSSSSSSSGYIPDYQNNFIPGQKYPNSYGHMHPDYSGGYRSDDPYSDDREVMSYSDGYFMDNVPSARFAKKLLPGLFSTPMIASQAISSYIPLNAANLAGLTGQIAQVGSSYGVFPNANVGGCNVPLLFSCTPSIVPGRISRGDANILYPSNVIGASPIDFRGVEDIQGLHPNRDENLQENSAPVKSPSAN